MLGRITMEKTRRLWAALEEEALFGLRLKKAAVPAPGRPGQLRRAARRLGKDRVSRVLVPPGFDSWDLLSRYGLTPVETEDFCRALAAPLALAELERLDLAPAQAVVALRGERVTRPMRMAALALCPRVRGLIISAPLGGEALQAELRREYGMPALSEGRGAPHAAVHFSPHHGAGGRMLCLYGPRPQLPGLEIQWRGGDPPADCDRLPLLAVLWETGRLRTSDCAVVLDSGGESTYNTG